MSEKKNNNSEFIRNHPNLSVADLILEASRKGLDIKKNLIYNVRSKDKKASESGSAPKGKKASKKSVVKAKATSGKKVSKKAKVAAVKPRRVQTRQASPSNGSQSPAPVAIVFFDADALVKGMKEGFPQVRI